MHKCSCCGAAYNKQKGNFIMSLSPLYYGNSGFLTVCRNCVEALYDQYVAFYSDDEYQAAERVCQMFDIYYDADTWHMSIGSHKVHRRFSAYLKKLNITRNSNRTQVFSNATYSDTILRRWATDLHGDQAREAALSDIRMPEPAKEPTTQGIWDGDNKNGKNGEAEDIGEDLIELIKFWGFGLTLLSPRTPQGVRKNNLSNCWKTLRAVQATAYG
jgi:hypothetical protein